MPRFLLILLAIGSLSTAIPRAIAQGPERSERPAPTSTEDVWCSTFSIVAYDPAARQWGVATASKILAVGTLVPAAEAEQGAIATQSLANLSFGTKGLELLRQGKTAAEVVSTLTQADPQRDVRQLGIVDRNGNVGVFTGKGCNPWCGEKVGQYYACLGNLLEGPRVIESMAKTFEETDGPLAWRMMEAMQQGEAAGGDRRGRQSAAIVVVQKDGGYIGQNDRAIDLRVDDHERPLRELERLLKLRLPNENR